MDNGTRGQFLCHQQPALSRMGHVCKQLVTTPIYCQAATPCGLGHLDGSKGGNQVMKYKSGDKARIQQRFVSSVKPKVSREFYKRM